MIHEIQYDTLSIFHGAQSRVARLCRGVIRLELILALALAFGAVQKGRAEDFIFQTKDARLVIRSDGTVGNLLDKNSGKERLRPGPSAFAAVRKGGQLFPSSMVERRGNMLHVGFGTSGVEADYRVTETPDYFVVQLTAFHGEGVEEMRLMQLDVSLPNAGAVLAVRWDDHFAVCLMGLSDHVDSRIAGSATVASVYPEFPMLGERVAVIASPTTKFLEEVRKVERDFRLPSPTLDGKWAKLSEDVRTSYLFTDLTEANVDETIRLAKLGGFRYILVYSGTWSASLGSYPINGQNFPHGEEGLKAVIDKCHAAGLKVGLHMLTSFVGKNDPLVRPKPSPWLLKDAEATLALDVSETATELAATAPPVGFPVESSHTGTENDFVIDDEIIRYRQITSAKFLQCIRGYAGTKPAPHRAGARIYHLVERYGSYLADLRTPLKDAIADRVAGVINRCGFDMIYFDGGEVNSANGPAWYWLGPQQMQIWETSKRNLLVQGSGMTHWTWHVFSRGTCDDFSAVAVKEYLDRHKIADAWMGYHADFLPTDLGWWGLLQDAPDHPATTPDEVEYYAVRMLALDSAVSLETNLKALKANGRTEEMLKLLGKYEQLRLSGAVPKALRQQLATGEWHMTRPGEFHPIRYDAQRVAIPGEITLKNNFGEQPLKFRLQVAPTLAAPGDPSNISLLRASAPIELEPPDTKATLPGSLIKRLSFTQVAQDQMSAFIVGPRATEGRTPSNLLDLTGHRALAIQLDVEGQAAGSGETPVLNIQLEADGSTYRDYYVDLDFRGARTLILPEPGTSRMLAEFRPAYANYPFKAAMYSFNYGKVVALNLRWMRYPKASAVRCRVGSVEAVQERNSAFTNIAVSTGSSSITIPTKMATGDYAEYWGDGKIQVFDHNGVLLSTYPVTTSPQVAPSDNKLSIIANGSGTVALTSITLGK
jgi:hypothetical protein